RAAGLPRARPPCALDRGRHRRRGGRWHRRRRTRHRSARAGLGPRLRLRHPRGFRRTLHPAVHRRFRALRHPGQGVHAAARAARGAHARPAARRHAVGDADRQPAGLVARLRRLRARGVQPLPQDLRHAARHLAVLPGRGGDRQPARLGRLSSAPAQGPVGGRRMTTTRKLLLSLAVLALAHTGVLAYMVVDRVTLLRSGRTITLPIIPVDPRDLFRGEYVRLGYAVSTVPLRQLEGPRPDDNAAFYVVLEKQPAGTWRSIKISRTMPREASPDRITLRRAPATAGPSPTRRTRRLPCATASRATSCPRVRDRAWRRWR